MVSAGFDIYNQFSKKNPASSLAEESSRINKAAGQYLTPFTDPNYWKIDASQLASQGIQYGIANAPAINQANMQQLQSLLNQAFPGYQSMFGQAATNAQQLMAGQLPSDVTQGLQRAAAQTGLAGGYGGPMTGSNYLRNLGLTSLQAEQTGTQQFGNLMQLASNYMMPQPVNPLSLLPLSTLINTKEFGLTGAFAGNQAMFNAKAMAAAAQAGFPPTSATSGLGGDISSILSNLTKSPSSQSGGGGSILSMLGGLFGGSGGGGGGGGGGIIDTSGLGEGTIFGY